MLSIEVVTLGLKGMEDADRNKNKLGLVFGPVSLIQSWRRVVRWILCGGIELPLWRVDFDIY